MEYRNVYFRIRSRYQYDSGWPDESDATEFREESRRLFQSADWDLHPGGDGISDTVTKGQQDLYLHPMNFSGIIYHRVSPWRMFQTKEDALESLAEQKYGSMSL